MRMLELPFRLEDVSRDCGRVVQAIYFALMSARSAVQDVVELQI